MCVCARVFVHERRRPSEPNKRTRAHTHARYKAGRSRSPQHLEAVQKCSLSRSTVNHHCPMGIVLRVWCSVFGVWCLVFGVWCLVYGV